MDHIDIIILLAAFVGMLGGIWTIARAFKKDLEETKTLMFDRFDDHKETVDKRIFLLQTTTDEKYVRLDLCNKTSGNIEGRLKSIDIKLDTLLRER